MEGSGFMSARRRFVALATLALVSGLVWVSPVSPVGTAPSRAVSPITVPGDYASIQAAINAAASGDTIQVGAGTYDERLTISKSLTLVSVDGPAQTSIIGGNAGIPIITATIPGASTFTLQGFRLSGGTASTNDYGGGILLSGAGNATIKGNVFYANQADLGGGAIYTTATGVVTIDGNQFLSNTASYGGAVAVSQVTTTTLVNNVFESNASGGSGSAVYWEVPPGYLASIRSNTFVNNYSYGLGTGGTAIHLAGTLDGSSVVRNNIVVGNTTQSAVVCEGSGSPAFGGNDFLNSGGAEVSGCADPVGTNGNVSLDPVFRNPDYNDYHLRPDSPLVDAGTADAGVTTDIDGDARPFDGDASGVAQIDIGADEATDSLLFSPDYIVFGSFGATEIGTHSDRTVTMQNVGGSSVSVTSAVVSGQIADQISTLADTCTGTTLGVGETCHIDLRYSPTNATSADAVLTVTSPGVGGTRDYNLSGYGSDPVQFWYDGWGDVPLGTSSPKYLHLVNNSTTQSVAVTSVALSGDAAADFTITNNPCTAAPIAPSTTCDIAITFKPSALGQRNAVATATGPSPLGIRPIDIYGIGVAPTTPVTFGTTYKAGPAYTWNSGNALGRTLKSTTQYLHQGYATDRISGTWAKDTGGPYAGIYYTRSTGGSTWGTPKRISPTSIHAIRFGLAASGSRVYVAYVTQTRINNFSKTAPRVLYVRTNTNHGSSSYWQTPIKLTSSTGRVDYPTVAASGYDVHVAWTDAGTGYVYVATSKDRGATWTKRKVGATTNASSEGRIGYPSVAVSGSTVAVTWVADASGALKTRVSADRGTNWGATEQHTSASTGEVQTAVRSGRVGVTWTDTLGVHVRTWTSGGGWGNDYLAAAVDTYAMYAASIALQGSARIAISWAEETATANYVRLRYAESTSNGATWYQPITLASTSSSARRANDWPSMVWPSAGTRYVSWNGWTNGTNNYRLYLRKGTGTPVGLASVARVMTPDAGIARTGVTPLREPKIGWLPKR